MRLMNTTHINTLQLILSNERIRLAKSKTEGEKCLRAVWVSQLEKEVANESTFIGSQDISDDDLLAALS